MAKANNKTTENNDSVAAFVEKITDADRRKDCQAIIDIMEKQSGFPAKMWGSAIIGFGTYHYVYESGREGDAPLVGFSPRKTEFALYLSSEFDKRDELLKQFGKHKTAKACVYVKKLEDVNVDVLKKMISNSIKHTRAKYK